MHYSREARAQLPQRGERQRESEERIVETKAMAKALFGRFHSR